MAGSNAKWWYLALLSLIWGSSFILIKKGLVGLTDYQLGSLRIVLTSIFLFSVGFKSIRQIERRHWKWVAISGFISSFFPPFLFAMAQNEIDSAVASMLNSVVPIMTLLTGLLLFKIPSTKFQIAGVIIGLLGTLFLILAGAEFNPNQNYWYSLFILAASVGYAFNVNIIKKYLNDISALAVTTGSFLFIVIPAGAILYATGFFETVFSSAEMQTSALYVAILSLFGTAIAKVVFNKLVQIASPVFASSVTYTMPVVAVLWGFIDGEVFSVWQILAAAVILFGVRLGNKRALKA
ncbi:MAG TPA: permease [Flavobacteriaceae bacterium]|jgi:drug/metabolite transporter (DMT)-like permease|nr:permease [Flavobacteriaceae bacterium]HBR54983.1 permease [Flavobacteriaceae bacterium]HIB46965.1 permease [Flavobacteriaceae bacterium]HIN99942.1 permease [Flavobacteriaceae bacterium]|tara:strand:+ start:130708 stop:131589 length:882 start_codon:yes stop_codon:yes gene_type:complete